MTTSQEEAERRWPMPSPTARGGGRTLAYAQQRAFGLGAEWLASEIGMTVEQVQRLGPLVEAARKFVHSERSVRIGVSTGGSGWAESIVSASAMSDLRAQVAALDGGTEAERPPESSS